MSFNQSDSRNERAAETGIQRVTMAALMMVLVVGGLLLAAGRAEAQSRLPSCPSNQPLGWSWHNCFGSYTSADGSKYVGEWKDGKPNGLGTYTIASGPNKGDKYVGEWKDDTRNGKGTFTSTDGSIYIGEFSDDKYNGAGKELDAMGNVMRQGYYVDGAYFGPTPPGGAIK